MVSYINWLGQSRVQCARFEKSAHPLTFASAVAFLLLLVSKVFHLTCFRHISIKTWLAVGGMGSCKGENLTSQFHNFHILIFLSYCISFSSIVRQEVR